MIATGIVRRIDAGVIKTPKICIAKSEVISPRFCYNTPNRLLCYRRIQNVRQFKNYSAFSRNEKEKDPPLDLYPAGQ